MKTTRRKFIQAVGTSFGALGIQTDRSKGASEIQKQIDIDKEKEYVLQKGKRLSSNIVSVPYLQGYCTPLSVSPGGNIEFYLSAATDGKIRYRIVRIRRNGVAVGIPMTGASGEWTGKNQCYKELDSSVNGCGWDKSGDFRVPNEWPSGIYAAHCIDEFDSDYYVTFVVRPRSNTKNKILVLANTNTWNAYNDWGGWNRYTYNGQMNESNEFNLSFKRPNPYVQPWWPPIINRWSQLGPPLCPDHDVGLRWGFRDNFIETPDFMMRHLAPAELWVMDWLQNAGFRFDVCSDHDLHCKSIPLEQYKLLIITTHPEYWTADACKNLASFLDGKSVISLGGNAIFEKVGYSEKEDQMVVTGKPENRTNLFFKDKLLPARDLLGLHPLVPSPPAPPEKEYLAPSSNLGDYYVVEADGLSNPFFQTAHLTSTFGSSGLNGRACGWEIDDHDQDVNDIRLLARGSDTAKKYRGEIWYFETGKRGFVFNAASINFGGCLAVEHAVQVMIGSAVNVALS